MLYDKRSNGSARSSATIYCIWLFCSLGITTVCQAQGTLQPESQQEFRRIFGTSRGPGGAKSNGLGMQAESKQEFARIFGQTYGGNALAGTVALQSISTAYTVDSTALATMLRSTDPRRYYLLWHEIALDVTAIDHRAHLNASPSTYHEQFGPARTARALGLVHQAMFEAANAIEQKYASTLPGLILPESQGASQDAAIVEAAYQVLAWLYPGLNDQQVIATFSNIAACVKQGFSLSTYYMCSLADLSNQNSAAALSGANIGRVIAARIIADRSNDGSQLTEPVWGKDFVPRQLPGASDYAYTQWQSDPVSLTVTALGGNWSLVQPFALPSASALRPPEATSPLAVVAHLDDYDKLPSYHAVHSWGQETRLDPHGKIMQPPKTGDALYISQFWAYDGTANLCAPSRLYNQVAGAVLYHLEAVPSDGYSGAINTKSTTDVARFFALLNLAMFDASVGAWEAKYYFQFPRPVTYVRALEAATAPEGANDPLWFPVGAQNTNSDQPYNITPPFPSYPSGHAVFGGALVGILRQFMNPTADFLFGSDEFNGRNKDVFNYVRCSKEDELTPLKFCSGKPENWRHFTLDCAERENADSRVFMGVHWVFDADDGISMGNKVARILYTTKMLPLTGALSRNTFSIASTVTTRGQLMCKNVSLPAGWDSMDPLMGFGPLKTEFVN